MTAVNKTEPFGLACGIHIFGRSLHHFFPSCTMKTNFFNQHRRSGKHSERKIVWIELWLIPSAALTFEEKIQQSLFLFFFLFA